MGHAGGDARLIGSDGVAAAAGDGAPRRTVEAVRRGAVRARGNQVRPSAWEHVEVTFSEDLELERISSLILREDGQFLAAIFDRLSEAAGSRQAPATPETHGTPVFAASGSWRPYRGGVELTLEADEALDLEELIVVYRLRRDCLVADEASLPDGLVQEYSRFHPNASSGGPRALMLADADDVAVEAPASVQPRAHELCEEVAEVICSAGEFTPPLSPASKPASPIGVVGLIEEGDAGSSNSEIEEQAATSTRLEAREELGVEDEEEVYADDFEGEDDASATDTEEGGSGQDGSEH